MQGRLKSGMCGIALLLLPVLASASETAAGEQYNIDYHPSGEVSPGVYGKMSFPVTSKFNLSIGGFARLDYAYNSENFGPNGFQSPDGTVPSRGITAQAAAAQQSQSVLTARTSRFWLKANGPQLLGAKTGSMIEADFLGDASAATESPTLRLRLAYATLDWENVQVLFGEEWDTFGPMVAGSLDFRNGTAYGTPNSQRVPQLRVTAKKNLNADDTAKLVFAVQDPNQTGNNQSAATGSYSSSPNVAAQLSLLSRRLGVAPGIYGYTMRPLTLTLFGLYGTEKAASNANHSIDSYGYGCYAFVPLLASKDGKNRAGSVALEAQTYAAANMAFNHATAQAVVGTPAAGVSNTFDPNGNLSPAKGYGYAAEIISFPTQDLGITVGYGSRRARNYDEYAGIASYQKWTSSFYANATYDLNAAIRVGLEYQNLETKYGNANGTAGESALGNDNTLRFVAMYFF